MGITATIYSKPGNENNKLSPQIVVFYSNPEQNISTNSYFIILQGR